MVVQVIGSCIILGNRLQTIARRLEQVLGKKNGIGKKLHRSLLYAIISFYDRTNDLLEHSRQQKHYLSCTPWNYFNVLRHCVTGEGYDADCTVSVSPLLYTVAKATIPGIYIRFMAVSSAKVSRSMSLL